MQDYNKYPTISIVIPVYNEAKVLPHAFEMIHALSLSEDEVVFVDGGSTDATQRLIQAEGFTCFKSSLGRARQMNHGAHVANSEIILFLHADTSLYSSNLSSIRKAYTEGFRSGRFNVKLEPSSISSCFISFFINIRSKWSKISTGDQAMFVRRDIFESLGGFKDIPLMEDIELSKRLKKLGKVACLTNKVATSSRRWEQNGLIRTVLLMWKLRFLYWIGVSPEKLAKMYRDTR